MNAKKCKLIRKQLLLQGTDIVNHKFHQVGEQVSEGRQIYQRTKEAEGANPIQVIKPLKTTHSHRSVAARKHADLKVKQRHAWRTDTSAIMKDCSLSEEKQVRRLDASFLKRNPGAFSIKANSNTSAEPVIDSYSDFKQA